MNNYLPLSRVKFGEAVFHAQPYFHPLLREKVPRDFYDRASILNDARRLLFSLENRQVLVFVGERRSGKTSVLKLLLEEVKGREEFVPVEIRWSGINSTDKLMQEMLLGLLYALGSDERELLHFCENVSRDVDFYSAITKIHEQYPEKIFVFGIDELDSIIKEQTRDTPQERTIAGFLGGLVDASLPIKLILTTTLEIDKISSDLAPKLESGKFRLKPFVNNDLSQMVLDIYPDIEEEETEKIYSLSGGWPYFAKAILYYLIQKPSSGNRFRWAQARALEAVSSTWQHIYQMHWNDMERTLLLLLAERGGKVAKDEIDSRLFVAIQTLIERGYLAQHVDGSVYFRVGLLYDWFLQWTEFEAQKAKYLAGLYKHLDVSSDPWMGNDEDIIEITQEDLRQMGLE